MPTEMRFPALMLALLAPLAPLGLPLPALAQSTPPPIPDLVRSTTGANPSSLAVLFQPEASAACDGQGVSRLDGLDLPPFPYGQAPGPPIGQRIMRVGLDFTIDAQGRTRDIRPTPAPSDADGPLTALDSPAGDLAQATVAGWRFAPQARSACRLTIRYTPVPIGQAEQSVLLQAFAVTRLSGGIRRTIQDRLSGSTAPCGSDIRGSRRDYPDFEAGQRRPGIQDWTVVRWNIDPDGRFVDAETLGSSGDAVFDAQARDSAERSQAVPGAPSTGCVYNWFRRGGSLVAPPMPQAPDDMASRCPTAVLSTFKPRSPGRSPGAFSERGIEGWALVRFDIAPWGEVGNVTVIEAQPAAAFGTAALALVASGRAEAGPGATRCVQPVLFRVPPLD